MKKTELSLGTASGTVLSTLPLISSAELLKTVLLAAIGATVSFLVTVLLQKYRRRR